MNEENREIERLQRENAILRQNAEAASRAPVRGVTGTGVENEREKSDFVKGLESDGW